MFGFSLAFIYIFLVKNNLTYRSLKRKPFKRKLLTIISSQICVFLKFIKLQELETNFKIRNLDPRPILLT